MLRDSTVKFCYLHQTAMDFLKPSERTGELLTRIRNYVLQSGRPSFVGYLEGFAQKFCSVSGAFESCLVWHVHVLFKVVDVNSTTGLLQSIVAIKLD